METFILDDFYKSQKSLKPIEYIKDGECFICVSHAKSGNYFKIKRNGEALDLHVWIHKAYIGEVPKGMVVRHLCNNSKCINPKHLKVGTYAENESDKITAGTYFNRVNQASIDTIVNYSISKRKIGENGTVWCSLGEHFEFAENFSKDKHRWNGLKSWCKNCRKKYRNKK